MSTWSIQFTAPNGELSGKKSLAEFGIHGVRIERVSLGVDTLTFSQPTSSMMDTPLCEEGAIVELFRDDVRWFYGRAADPQLVGDARRASFGYQIAGAWWWLENMGFRQAWKCRQNLSEEALTESFTSHVLLGSKVDGTLQTIRDQIAEAVAYAASQGAPIAFDGTGLPEIFPPLKDVFNATVAEVIRKMVEWAPDIVAWFDYTTTPPTLRMRRRENQAAVELPARNESLLPVLEIQPRNDLKAPGVIIYYIRADEENGRYYTVITEDKFPNTEDNTGREPKALLAAINLEGAIANYVEASVTCEMIEPMSVDWWKARSSDLASPTISAISIKPGSARYYDETGAEVAPLPRELIGVHAEWMGGNVRELTVQVSASYTEKFNDGELTANNTAKVHKDKPIMVTITATDLETGVYRSDPSGVQGEGVPTGLAEALYRATSVTHFEGRVVIKEQQCSGRVSTGQVLNLTDGRPEWASMRAQVQSVTEEIDQGQTTVVFGPPKHLGPVDQIELLRATRNRIRFASPATRATGVASNRSAILPQRVAKQVPTAAAGGVLQQVWKDPTWTPNPANPATNGIPGSISFRVEDTAGKEITIREMPVCVQDGTNLDGTPKLKEGFIRVPCSDIYFRS